MSDFSLIETMRWEPGTGIVRLRLHLARLRRSAGRLGFAGADKAERALDEALSGSLEGKSSNMSAATRSLFSPTGRSAERMRGDEGAANSEPTAPSSGPSGHLLPAGEKRDQTLGPLRVRLTLSPTGEIAITTAPFSPLPGDTIWRVAIASTRLNSSNKLLRHKTTRREIYETARAEYPATEADEVLLLNEKGEPCEGTITSIFLDDGTGVLRTPPIACGLLAGVLRTELICARRARIQRLTLAELQAGTLYMGNSLRGLIRAKLLTGD